MSDKFPHEVLDAAVSRLQEEELRYGRSCSPAVSRTPIRAQLTRRTCWWRQRLSRQNGPVYRRFSSLAGRGRNEHQTETKTLIAAGRTDEDLSPKEVAFGVE